MSHSAMNIYQMYVANGNKVGFKVKRNSWSTKTAIITSIDGEKEGLLNGEPPYFDNPKVKGIMSGTNYEVELTCAGTYGYHLITD
jgi:hypothetical protein